MLMHTALPLSVTHFTVSLKKVAARTPGGSSADAASHAAHQVDQILKGAKAGEIPFYQATKFELVVNLKTAKELGITFPPSIIVQADEVIE
jgi:putative ABC transport system substrate-binding protein